MEIKPAKVRQNATLKTYEILEYRPGGFDSRIQWWLRKVGFRTEQDATAYIQRVIDLRLATAEERQK